MDYLNLKWKLWYKSLDVNHDGIISFEDVEQSRSKFAQLHELLGDKAKGVSVDMENWWTVYILPSKEGSVSEAQFLEQCQSQCNANKQAFVDKMTKCFNTIFDVIDTNKDRSIELDEFIIAFKAFGHENEQLLTKAFKIMSPDGKPVPLKDIVAAWIQFTTCEDSSKTDVVKRAFDEGF